jgi:hypothetical protein
MELPTLKCSTIYIATAEGTRVYRSASEIPPEVRQSLASNSRQMQSATLLIADRNGREELARAIQGLPSRVSFRGGEIMKKTSAQPVRIRLNWKAAGVELGIAAGLVFLAWLLVIYK